MKSFSEIVAFSWWTIRKLIKTIANYANYRISLPAIRAIPGEDVPCRVEYVVGRCITLEFIAGRRDSRESHINKFVIILPLAQGMV